MIVADAGPLIAFARIKRLDLLLDLFGEIIIPEAVYGEIVTRGRGRPGAKEIAQSPWIRLYALENSEAFGDLPSTLHRGEREAIALAQQLGAQLLIDEHRGRKAAQAHGLDIIGTLAVLAEAKRRGIIDHTGPLLAEMVTLGYWMDASLVVAFLATMGEGGGATQ